MLEDLLEEWLIAGWRSIPITN